MDRPVSGKSGRYELAKRKYEMFQNKQDKLQEMDNILTGKHKETIVPKPGEFMIVSTDKKVNPSDEFSLGLDELLDVIIFQPIQTNQIQKQSARQTIKTRLESARKTSKQRITVRGTSQGANTYHHHKSSQQLHQQNDDNMLSSIQSQAQRRFPIVNLGNINNQQMSQRMRTMENEGANSDLQIRAQSEQYSDSGYGGVGVPRQMTKGSLMNPSQYNASEIVQSARGKEISVFEKQQMIVQNPDMKISMTTSIRNIMRKQDRDMLTSSSRLLHSQLEAFEQQMKIREHQQTVNEAKSSLDILQTKISQYQNAQKTFNQQTILPSLSKSGIGGQQSDQSHIHEGISHAQSSKNLTRPGSAFVLFGGDKEALKQAKSRVNIKGSRQRDIITPTVHSYKPQPQKYQLEKVKDATLASHIKVKPIPELVQQQIEMIKDKDLTSPFLEDNFVQPIIIHDINPKVTNSPLHEAIYQQFEERQKSKEKSPLRYSYNMNDIKQLRQRSTTLEEQQKITSKVSLKSKAQQKKMKTVRKSIDQNISEEEMKQLSKKFLPIDAYDPMMDVEDPEQIIEEYRDNESGKTIAKSKWFFANGESEMRQCEVLKYLANEELYQIRWLINDSIKKVSRFNLVFIKEDEREFYKRIEEAKHHREQAELIMKYYYLIQNTKIPSFEISDDQKTRISFQISSYKSEKNILGKRYRDPMEFLEREAKDRYIIFNSYITPKEYPPTAVEDIHKEVLVRKYNLNLMGKLFTELDDDYMKSHKQIYFDSQLPYSTDKYSLLKPVLPAEKFIPVSERIIGETERKGLIQISERSTPFKELLHTMSKKLHQANQEKLDSLNRVNQNMIKFAPMNFFQIKYKVAKSKEMYIKTNRLQASDVLRQVRNAMFDSQYEINTMVKNEVCRINDINTHRRKAASFQSKQLKEETLSKEFLDDMTQFQSLLNMLYERQLRQCYENSINSYIQTLEFMLDCKNQSLQKNIKEMTVEEGDVMQLAKDPILAKRLEQKFQFKIELTFNKDIGQVELTPSPDNWIKDISALIKLNVEEIAYVPCFLANEIGHARENGKVRIFESENDPFIVSKLKDIEDLLRHLFKIPQALHQVIAQYGYILAIDIKQFKQNYKINDYPVEKYKEELEKNQKALAHIDKLLFDDRLSCGLFLIKTVNIKIHFTHKIQELNKVMFYCIKKKIDQTNASIETEVTQILDFINTDPIANIEQLTEIQNFLNNLDKKMQVIKDFIQDVMGKMGLLEDYQYKLSEDEFNRTWLSFSKPLEIFRAEYNCKRRIVRDQKEFYQSLRLQNENLVKDFDEIKLEFDILQRSEELKDYEDAAYKSDQLFEKLDSALETAKVVNRREGLFGVKKSNFKEIEDLNNAFMPYFKMWNLARDYYYKVSTWMNGQIIDFDREKITSEITNACQTLLKLEKVEFKERKVTAQICYETRKFYEEFKPFLPLIMALRNPSLKMRHWEQIQRLCDPPLPITFELNISIQELVEKGVMQYIEDINEISDCSSRERKLEEAIAKMRDEWKHIKFDLNEFRDSGTYVLKGAEPIWDLLDEHIMKTMTIASSPYIKFLQYEVNTWKHNLIKVQEILEEWTKVQRGWLYLWPIFSSEDIQKQMPIISANFQTVDKIWRNVMLNTFQNPNVLEACLQGHKVFENFQSCNEMIDRIQKGLNEYLNTKRMAFPRFFFLSNDDLLHILSQTKDPLRVQDHLNKCFEGIDKLEFKEDKTIRGMYSLMGEYIEFTTVIDPFSRTTGDVRKVEDWLSEVEVQMRDSLRDLVRKSGKAYSIEDRKNWILKWPQQIVLTMDQVFWTLMVEEEGIKQMQTGNKNALRDVYKKEEKKLEELVDLIKTPRSNEVDVLTLGALIVLDVHSKDVTKELVLQDVKNLAAFEWISQLRYYVIDEPGKSKDSLLEINVKMVSCVRLYGFEYLGNQTRLVITPLTDRCYRTLMGALQLNLGGAPEGPAGTGKTETTKDLAKAIAKQCIVFNCSDQLDVQAMAKFFKGLACCGAWACFDEFNRIELEVLSVIAQQILQIQTALMRKRPFAPFQFEDETIPMNPTCAVFITMNPGYAGRSELPDNLKALFRPVAMMIPNYAMIAEISLYSFGFQNARELSIKITQSLRLSSEQLSTQSHYDYGMRAVKSIILAAGGLKRDYPQELDESKLVLRAISDCNIPKFISEDIPLFEGIISDLFPTTDKTKPSYEILQKCIKKTMKSRDLMENDEFENKTIQLFETVQVRHGLMMVGQTMSSKTEIINTLGNALTLVNKLAQQKPDENGEMKGNFDKVKVDTINPKAITIGQLYGDFDKISHDWSDGILAKVIKDCASDKTGNRRWILMDGPVDAVWIENLNTVLDDNKKLCLSSGEIVKFTPKMTMMFEVEDLLEASPATVSRCGMVFLDPEKIGWQIFAHKWLQTLPNSLTGEMNNKVRLYQELINYFIPNVIGFLFGYDQTLEEEKRLESLKSIIPVTKNWMFRSFLSLFESLLLKKDTRQGLVKKEQEQKDKQEAKKAYEQLQGIQRRETKKLNKEHIKVNPIDASEILSMFLMALTWSFGGSLHQNGRFQLSEFLLKEMDDIFKNPHKLSFGDDIIRKMILEESGDFFQSFYNYEKQEWLKWDYDIESFNIFGKNKKSEDEELEEDVSPKRGGSEEVKVEFSQILIPTEDTIRYSYILNALGHHQFPVLFIGETGTGKTQTIKKYSSDTLSKDEWETGQMVLSATATAYHVQEYIQSKVEKQKKGVYGPKVPGHRIMIFVDDLNMPAKEKYGAQPPIEMLRQTIDLGGFYELKENELIKIVEVLFVAAMGIPGGGRSLPTKRLTRHFNLIHIPPYSSDNLFRIFSKILEWGYSQYPDGWQRQVKPLTKLSIAIYEKAVQILLPLPSKSHYLFNLRQVSEIVQGMLMVPLEVVEKSNDKLGLLHRLWLHETQRVFTDRLINEEDQKLFLQAMKETVQKTVPNFLDIGNLKLESIIFNNFVQFNPNDPQYDEVKPESNIRKTIDEILEYYNQMNKDKLTILIFDYVIQHLSRISRIIFKPYGNALLIGLGGNGRKSLAKLATFINECQIFKVDITKSYGRLEWQDDLKSLYKSLGLDNKKVVFTFNDSDIKYEQFIEDINNILNVGEVPNLYTLEDIEEIKYEMEKQKAPKKLGDYFDQFINRCKKNLHILLFMSPAGSKLRQYIRQYPSLVNCASIDWFLPWPEDALKTVSMFFLEQSPVFVIKYPQKSKIKEQQVQQKQESSLGTEENEESELKIPIQQIEDDGLTEEDRDNNNKTREMQKGVGEIFVKMHNYALDLSVEYYNKKRRQVYITPTRFIEVFKLFDDLMLRKHKQLDNERNKYLIGIQKLDEANIMVDQMKEQLEELKPVLEKKSKQVEVTMITLDKESKEVEAIKEVVDKEAQIVAQQKAVAEGIKNECEARLSDAQPLLDEALKALRTLNVKDFVTMKSYNQPPYPIKLALEASCIMLGVPPKMIEVANKNGKPGNQKVPDYWEKSKKLLNDYKKYIGSMENYPKDDIPEDRIQKIQEYLNNPKFVPEEIRKASEAAEGICKWVRAICKYDIVAKEIRPKREKLGQATAELEVVTAKLKEKQDELQKIIDKKNKLEEEFKNQNFEKQNLIMQRDDCQAKLGRASILMNSLGNERNRWVKTSQRLQAEKISLIGDMLLTTGFLTYLGPFEGTFREKIVKNEWRNLIKSYNINVAERFYLKDTIGTHSSMQLWQLKGLPADNVSNENMIIIEETKDKWPLIIDPQSQALKFIKDLLDQNFILIKLQSDNYTRKLEAALLSGATVICEGIGETVDSVINSIVCKDVYEVGGDKYIKFNDNQVEFNEDFRFYLISNLANPHFSPELQAKAKVLNFSVTKEGLQQQLLSIVCRHESQRDEDERDRIQRQNADFKEQKRVIEEQILSQLRNAGQDILENDTLVNSLNESKKITDDIKIKLKTAKMIEERIEENRKHYFPVAEHGAKLYFCIQELPHLDPMYQFSMKWFRQLFEQSFTYSEKNGTSFKCMQKSL